MGTTFFKNSIKEFLSQNEDEILGIITTSYRE